VPPSGAISVTLEGVRVHSIHTVVLMAVAILLLGERAAYAYVDPGTGNLIYQTLLTLVIGVGLVFRQVRYSVGRFFKRLAGRNPD
jgi:hypothetical protein